MSTLTPRLKLIRNDGLDPFKRQDFIDNWNKIDAAPGVTVCTSTSRPTWGAAQAGMQIQETDTKRQLLWTGTSWQDALNVPPAWFMSKSIGQDMASGTDAKYNIGTFTTSRALNATIIMNVKVACLNKSAQVVTGNIFVDDKAKALSTGWNDNIQWSAADGSGGWRDYRILNMFAPAAVDAGTHKVDLQAIVGKLSTQSVLISALSAVIIGTNTTGR